MIVCLSACVAFLEKQSGYPKEFYGLTLKNWQKNAFEAFLYTIPILIVMVVLKWLFIRTIPQFTDMKLLSLGVLGVSPIDTYGYSFVLFYIILAPLQEFIARGCLQSCSRRFLPNAEPRVFIHRHVQSLVPLIPRPGDLFFGDRRFLLGLFWGWLYARQRSIVGCSVSHALCGVWAFGFLDYQNIWVY